MKNGCPHLCMLTHLQSVKYVANCFMQKQHHIGFLIDNSFQYQYANLVQITINIDLDIDA